MSNGLLLGGVIGEGLKSFVNSYNATQDRQRQQAESDELRAMRRRQMQREEMEGGFETDPDSGELRRSDEYKTQKRLGLLSDTIKSLPEEQRTAPYGQNLEKERAGLIGVPYAEPDPNVKPKWQQQKDYDHKLIMEREGVRGNKLTPQQRYDQRKYEGATAIPNMQLKPGFRPPEKTVEDLRAQKNTVDLMNTTIDKLDEAIGKYGTAVLPGEENALMGSLVTDLQLRAKEFQKLGVLNGPDLALMMKQFGDPTSLRGKALGPKALQLKLKQMKALINNGLKTTAANSGFDLNAPDYVDPGLSTGPRPGDIEDGHEFKGGDPRDRNNWIPVNTSRAR